MKAYLLTASTPNVCKVEEVEVVKMTNTRVYLDNDYRLVIQKGYIFDTYIEYFRDKEEAYEKALTFAKRFLEISSENLTAAQCNFRTLLDARNPSLFDVINEE